MPNGDWREGEHPRDEQGRFVEGGHYVPSGVVWYVDETQSDHEREHVAHDRAHDAQHASEQKAIEIAAATVKQWKEDGNEWRSTLSDRDGAYAKTGELTALDQRLRLIEAANIRREQSEQDRVSREARDKADVDRRQSRQLQLFGLVLGIPALIGAVAGVIALVRAG